MTAKSLSIPVLAVLAIACGPLKLNENNIDKVADALSVEEKCHLLIGGDHLELPQPDKVEMIASSQIMLPGSAGFTYPVERLGIPAVILADGPAGLRIESTRKGTDKTFYCTGFPIGSLLSSTWDMPLVEEVAAAIGEEVRDYGVDVLLAPGLNLQRNPLCGRNFEYFSEDPLLTGKSAAAYVRGVQSKGVGTSIKHFAANNEEINRLACDSRVSTRAMRELYLKGFEIAVKEGRPWTVMSSYNRLNGRYTSERRDLLEDVLRGDWGFDGLVMSDWGGGFSAAYMVGAGNDLIEPGNMDHYNTLLDTLRNPDCSQDLKDAVDVSVKRVLKLAARSPKGKNYRFNDTPDLAAHAEIARRAAADGLVLLKNEAALPLSEGNCVAVFGANSYKLMAGGTGAGDVNKAYVINLPEGLEADGICVEPGVDAKYRAFAESEESRLEEINRRRGWWFGKLPYSEMPVGAIAAEAASRADAAVITIARQAGEGHDRLIDEDYLLRADELKMIKSVSEAFHALGKKVTVIINAGGIMEMNPWQNDVDAVLLAWQPGQEAGYAIADILSGKVCPSGRLPITIPNSYADVPSQNFPQVKVKEGVNGSFHHYLWGQTVYEQKDIDYIDYLEDIYVGYRYYSTFGVAPAYPFGFGLSYTSFDQKIESCRFNGRDAWKVKVSVTNTGDVAGKDVVMLYSTRACTGNFPAVELRAFGKTSTIQPGGSETVVLEVKISDLASYDEAKSAWTTPAGNYVLSIARNADEFLGCVKVELTKGWEQATSDCLHPVGPEGKGLYIDGGTRLTR